MNLNQNLFQLTWMIVVVLAGNLHCSSGEDNGAGGDADTDADTDVDTDADTDVDTDADTNMDTDDPVDAENLLWAKAGIGGGVMGALSDGSFATAREATTSLYDSGGELIWQRQGEGLLSETGLTVTEDGSVMVTGHFRNKLIFGIGEPNETVLEATGYADILVVRFNPDGTLAWAKQAGDEIPPEMQWVPYEKGTGITSSPDGSALVSGLYYKSAIFGRGEPNETILVAEGGDRADAFLARYNPDGTLAWVRSAGGEGGIGGDTGFPPEGGYDVIRSVDGSFLLAGVFEGKATFGKGEPNETVLQGTQSYFLAKYSPEGSVLWAQKVQDKIQSEPVVRSFPDGSAILVGTDQVNMNGIWRLVVSRVDSSGALAWSKPIAQSTWYFGAVHVGVLSDGSVLVVGKTQYPATIDMGGPDETPLPGDMVFLLKLSPNAALSWLKQLPSEGGAAGEGFAVFSDDSFAISGWFNNRLILEHGEPDETVIIGGPLPFAAVYGKQPTGQRD